MELIYYLLFGWFLSLIPAYQNIESISFSPIDSKGIFTPISYWYGNVTIETDRSLLEEGVAVNIYLNQYQGLLFYAIDKKYRTLWVEFAKDVLEISYYNFRIDYIDKQVFKLETLCSAISDKKINLVFTLISSNILITCNGKPQTIAYTQPEDPLPQKRFEMFINNMLLPIPLFNNSNTSEMNLVHIWIGNTPSSTDTQLYNVDGLKSNQFSFWGCVKLFTVGNIPVKLATTGERNGAMITPFCKPVCNSTSCSNHGICTELWRGRLSCDCGLSQFIGDHCNEEYSVKFDGQLSLGFPLYFRFQKLKFSFQPVIYGNMDNQKLLSIQFKNNMFLQIYVASNGYLHSRFKYLNKLPDVFFKVIIADGQNYTFVIDSDLDNIYLELADSRMKYIYGQQKITHYQNNLIIEHILVGDSHSDTMSWMKKYNGCFSNLVLQADKRKYVWNELPNFNDYPKCGTDIKTTISSLSKSPANSRKTLPATDPQSPNAVNRNQVEINTSYMTYIAIGVSIFVLLLISVIVIYRCIIRRERRHFSYTDKAKLTFHNESQKPPESIRSSYSIPYTTSYNTRPMTFKPAYKARSIISSSPYARSMISLPMSMTPTLVTPEGEVL